MKACPPKANPRAFTLIELLVIIVTVVVIACFLVPALVREPRKAKNLACSNNLKQVGLAFKIWTIDNGDTFPMAISTNGVVTNNYGITSNQSARPLATTNGPGTQELINTGQAYVHFRVISNELSTPKILVCPNDKTKTVALNFDSALSDKNISYFVGTDAQDIYPNTFLSGDRNLAFSNQPLKPGLFTLATNNPALSWTKAIHNSCGNLGLADGSVQLLDSKRLTTSARNQDLATNRLVIP
jgi:type II secretory pathway pseudopilin PulG